MTTLDEYVTSHPSRRGSPCSVCSLPPDVLEAVDRHLLKRTVRSKIADWLVDEGYDVTKSMLDNHVGKKHVAGY